MSFGFEERHKAIGDAIRHAAFRGRLMFAAASNEGRNRGIVWPARETSVMCVHSGDGNGTRSSFTPSSQDGMKIMALGECIKSASPPHLNLPDDEGYMSGTSCATPIAAGIAAIILDYARGFLEDEKWEDLRQTTSMRRMFEKIKDENLADYWWIRHWELFHPKRSTEWIQDQIRQALD